MLVAVLLVVIVLPCGLIGWRSIQHGSLRAGLSHCLGQEMIVLPRTIDVGVQDVGQSRECQFEVLNMSDHPVTILGVGTSCGCMHVKEDLPTVLAGNRSLFLPVKVHFEGPADSFQHKVVVFTDLPGNGVLDAQITGRNRHKAVGAK